MAERKLAPREVVARREGEVWYLESALKLEAPPARLGDLLRRAASRAPDRDFLIERCEDGLRRVTYREALRAAEGVGDWLVRDRRGEGPVVALSGNSVDHALVMLGCFLAGVPFVPVSPAYSLMSQDFAKLRAVVTLVRPSVIYLETEAPFGRPLAELRALVDDVPLLVGRREAPLSDAALSVGELFARKPNGELRAREAAITPDHIAKVLFTSGSTGFPKGVPNTHRMLCSNQQMIAQCWPFLEEDEPLVMVDWLPWSHTFGGNHNFNMVLFHAGTLFVDEGKPTDALVSASLRNLREVPPTLYFNVPAGYAALVPRLEQDDDLRRAFFSRLQVMFYAAAALPPDLWTRLVALAKRSTEHDIFMTTAWGSTETSPLATSAHFRVERSGNIGLPAPGVSLKLVPNESKLEVRVKGPNVMQGYLNEPELTKHAFDDEGYYRIGDAVRFAEEGDPASGLVFDGRVAEDFKLASGTWVSVTGVRTGVVAAAAGLLADVVVCGHDREYLALLAWPSVGACQALVGRDDPIEELVNDDAVRARVREGLMAWNAKNSGSSTRIQRLLLLCDPPSIDAGEITDKGYTNQRAVVMRRAADVERVYDPVSDESTIDVRVTG
ncbi:MAG TPA: feruloyl-CoA synthase [Vicinamibacterales bacterium]|nr:feruloyl-CoA synthase [Vicinamibacterales bacterium]